MNKYKLLKKVNDEQKQKLKYELNKKNILALKTIISDRYNDIIKIKEIIIGLGPKVKAKPLSSKYITHKIYNPTKSTISIVMTTHNRLIQTLFTLQTISESKYKNIQVILVDDYFENQYSDEDLKSFGIYIDYIKIKNKFWINPCVNYNIGFRYIQGNKVIIQNSEVCHAGDIISYINDNLKDDIYMSFDVVALKKECNKILYSFNSTEYAKLCILRDKKYICRWYQHNKIHNKNLHFLTALTKYSLNKINGFDNDYCLGTSWDDNALLFKIIISNIEIVAIDNEKEKIMGIHQWHPQTTAGYAYTIKNGPLYKAKAVFFDKNNIYLDLFKDDNPDNIKKRIEYLFSLLK